MNKESTCPKCEIDDWGICTWKEVWNEDCDNNCYLHLDKADL